MSLLVVVLILLVWAGYGIVQALQPEPKPIENIDEHLQTLYSLPNAKARQKYLRKQRRKDRINNTNDK